MSKQIQTFRKLRIEILSVINELSTEQLNKIPAGFNNNIIWNFAHIMVIQQYIIYGKSNLPFTLEEKYFPLYKSNTKPEKAVSGDEISEIKHLFTSLIDQLKTDLENNLFVDYQAWTHKQTGIEISSLEDAFNFLVFHESFHLGYIRALKRQL